MQRVTNPLPLFLDARGNLLDGGKVYVGVPGGDPQTDPVTTYKDAGLTQVLEQPIRVIGGIMVDGANAAIPHISGDDYSIRVRDSDGSQVFYVPSTAEAATPYQPLDADLTAISALSTNAFGRNLLTLANAAALQAAVGLPPSLPLSGGTMAGSILRAGAGAYGYALPAAMTGFRLCGVDPVGTADATSQPGDWQAFY